MAMDKISSIRSYTAEGIDEDRELAGRKAAEQVFRLLKGECPRLILILVTPDVEYATVYNAVKHVFSDSTIVGASVVYMFSKRAVVPSGLTVTAVLWDGLLEGPVFYAPDSDNPEMMNDFLPSLKKAEPEYKPSLFTLWSGYNYIVGTSMQWYDYLGPLVPIVGGGCFMVAIEDDVRENCGIAFGFLTRESLRYVRGHGCSAAGRPIVITRAEGTTIFEIDGMPAVKAYDRLCSDMKEQEKNLHAHEEIEWSFAFGYPTRTGEYVLLEPVAINRDEGTIQMFTEVPSNSVLRLLVGSREKIQAFSEDLLKNYVLGFDSKPGLNCIINCVGRVDSLGHGYINYEEIPSFIRAFGEDSFFGFASIGELCSQKGSPVFNHQKNLVIFGG